jgi:anti-sigma-K factor RskA
VDSEKAQAATEVAATARLFDGLTVMQQRLHELRAVQGYITAEAEMAQIIARRRAELAALDERLAAVRIKVAEADACRSTN